MLLCLDIGNTDLLVGVFQKDEIIARFRYNTSMIGTADQLGIFLWQALTHHKMAPEKIKGMAVSSVVPRLDFTVKHMAKEYFKQEAFYLQAGVKTGLNIKYKNPLEVGADRIANAVGAIFLHPKQNIIMVDMGTATTIDTVTKNGEYLGGVIMPGVRLSVEALAANTAKLMSVQIERPTQILGQVTKESIQNGIYFSQLGAIKEIIAGYQREIFKEETFVVLGTGGFSSLYKEEKIFDALVPDMVLIGLKQAYEMR